VLLAVAPFDRPCMISYQSSIVGTCTCTITKILSLTYENKNGYPDYTANTLHILRTRFQMHSFTLSKDRKDNSKFTNGDGYGSLKVVTNVAIR